MLIYILASIAGLTVVLLSFSLFFVRRVSTAYPPLGEFVKTSAGQLHVLRRGSGVPVIMLHGASGNLRDWTASIFDEVASSCEAFAIDRPGHGWSERKCSGLQDPRMQADAIHEALVQLGVNRPIIIGHSLAGAVALAYALRHPANTGGLLFLSGVSHPWPGGVGWAHEVASRPILGHIFAWLLGPLGFWLKAPGAIRNIFSPNAPPKGYASATGAALYARPSTLIANGLELTKLKPAVSEMALEYHRIDAPMIALTGDKDSVIYTHLHTPPLVDKVAGAELRVLAGVGVNRRGTLTPYRRAILTPLSDVAAPAGWDRSGGA